jgi:hypothetical protein
LKKNIILAPFILIIFAFLLSGCSLRQIDSLMRPPMAQGDYLGLQESFYKKVGNDVVLKSPLSGQYRSAFILYDIDKDGEDEALVFYVNSNDKATVHLHFLKKMYGVWRSAGDFIGAGSDVDSVAFVNIGRNDLQEMIISWRLYENKTSKFFTIYSCEDQTNEFLIKAVSTEIFTEIEVLDIDGDGDNEIFIVHLDTTKDLPQAFAKIIRLQDDGKVAITSQARLDGNVGSYGKIRIEKLSEQYPVRLYIDAKKGETQMITEMILWDEQKGTLIAPLFNSQTQSNTLTLRNERIPSTDINNDGIIEIPTQTLLPGINNPQQEAGSIYLTKWSQFQDDGEAVEIMQSIINTSKGYMLIVPKEFVGRFAIHGIHQNGRWDVYLYNSQSDEQGELLFSILTVDQQEWSENVEEYMGFIKILSNSDNVIAARIYDSGKNNMFDTEFLRQSIVSYKGE